MKHAIDISQDVTQAMGSALSQTGESLAALAQSGRTLIVFLRHGGCTFCRETLDDVRKDRTRIERDGVRIVLVHMMEDGNARELFVRYGLDDLSRISDPRQELYRAFGLQRAGWTQLLNGQLWLRGLLGFSRHGAGTPEGDTRQLAGVFLVEDGIVIAGFRHRSAADRPDYTELACGTGDAR